ncbi:hypothetical protein G7046_g5082 [Stylonectria norvegica]|nr:hypothetical protein G7046_g5082 [Stylonectria norvegica]
MAVERQQTHYPSPSFKPEQFKAEPFKNEQSTEDTRTADEINRQLQQQQPDEGQARTAPYPNGVEDASG